MRRSVIKTVALALALAPAAVFAQPPQPVAGQPPAGQPPAAAAPAAPAEAKPPRLALTGSAMLLYQVKPDQTATFDELLAKAKDSVMKSANPVRKQQLTGWRFYKTAEGMGPNALYVCVIDPAVPATEYDLLMLVAEGFGADAGTPDNQALLKKFVDAFASGANKLTLTPMAFTGSM